MEKVKFRIQKVTRIKDGTWFLPQRQWSIFGIKWWSTIGEGMMYRDEWRANEQIEIYSGIKTDKYETIKEYEIPLK